MTAKTPEGKLKKRISDQKLYLRKREQRLFEKKRWVALNPNYSRNWHFQRRYGITVEDYDNMVEERNSLCEICLKQKKLHVDHCHKTGVVRGLLCGDCNRGIGLLGDSTINLDRVKTYLEKWERTDG